MPESIIMFDGVCNLCNSTVDFIMQRDKAGKFRFVALQSEEAIKMLQAKGIDPLTQNSLILSDADGVWLKSIAVLRIMRQLGGVFSVLYPLRIVPPFARDFIYDRIAANRYKWFGKRSSCRKL